MGLDADALVAQFNQETADIKEEPMDMLVIDKQLRLPSRKTLWIVFCIICLCVIVWGVVSEILSPDAFSKMPVPEIASSELVSETAIDVTQEVPAIADEVAAPVKEEIVAAPEKKEVKSAPRELDLDTLKNAKVAFVATREVWVELTNAETGKKILAKAMAQNEYYIPSVDLSKLVLSTGRSGLALYQNGQKTKSFGSEKNRSLADLVAQN